MSLGYMAIYLIFAAMYWNAWRQREPLNLDRLERTLTRNYISEQASVGAVGLLSCVVVLTLPEAYAGLAGFIYCLVGAVKWLYGRRTGKMSRRVRAEMAAEIALNTQEAAKLLEQSEKSEKVPV